MLKSLIKKKGIPLNKHTSPIPITIGFLLQNRLFIKYLSSPLDTMRNIKKLRKKYFKQRQIPLPCQVLYFKFVLKAVVVYNLH